MERFALQSQELQSRNTYEAAKNAPAIRNRYRNVLAPDHSRVVLTSSSSSSSSPSSSDYINASWVPSVGMKVQWAIACQAPPEGTVSLFWDMMGQTRCAVVVNTCQECEEEGTQGDKVCDRMNAYWAGLEVRACRDAAWGKELEVLLPGEGGRIVTVILYRRFVNFRGPDVESLVSVAQRARELQGEGPVVAHCMAGLGRACTFLFALAMVSHGKPLSREQVLNYMLSVRAARPGAFDCQEQLHACFDIARHVCGELL